MTDKTGGPAFPQNQVHVGQGMTLRDYFAAKVMQGLLAADDAKVVRFYKTRAECAYAIADAMLKEREK